MIFTGFYRMINQQISVRDFRKFLDWHRVDTFVFLQCLWGVVTRGARARGFLGVLAGFSPCVFFSFLFFVWVDVFFPIWMLGPWVIPGGWYFFFAMSGGHLFKGVGGSTQTMGPSPSFLQVQFLCGQVNNISSLMSHKENIFSMGH